MRTNSHLSAALRGILFWNELRQDEVAIRDARPAYKRSLPPKIGRRLLKRKQSKNLLRGRLGRCFLCASRRFSGGIWSFGCSGTRHFSRRRRRGCGSWSCRGSDGFSFLLARREKRGTSQNADVFLHNSRGYCFNRSIAASAVFGPSRMLLETQMARHEH